MSAGKAEKKRRVAPPAKPPKVVVITGAAGNIGYSLAFQIAHGTMLGPDQPMELRLLEIPEMIPNLNGVVMELVDSAFPLVTSVLATSDPKEAFQNCDIALLVGARPRGPGMDRADLLKANAPIFQAAGAALDQYASRDVKVLVVGNPANTNALIALSNAPSLSPSCFNAMTRLDHTRMVGQLCLKLNTPADRIKNVAIWGNHSNTMFADLAHAKLLGEDGSEKPVLELVDHDWAQGAFLATVANRGAEVIKARGLSSAGSAANAIVQHMRSWVLGTQEGEFVSMGVLSDGSYGIPEGIVYSFPCTCAGGQYEIVQGLEVSDFAREKMRITANELLEERKTIFGTK